MKLKKQIFVSWTHFQRRQVSMQPHFGFDVYFLPVTQSKNLVLKAISYFFNSALTLFYLFKKRPNFLWVQLPQVPLLWVALFYRNLFNRRVVLIADCHNAMFRKPWSELPYGITRLKACDMILVHNSTIAEKAYELGVPREKTKILEDPPAKLQVKSRMPLPIDFHGPIFVFPASFADDEPITELVSAARLVPDINIVITGGSEQKLKQMVAQSLPKNVFFTGYLPQPVFENLLTQCDAIIALTRLQDVQLSVCGEAVGVGKPMLLTDTSLLRCLYPRGTVFTAIDDPKSIAHGVRELLCRVESLTREMEAFKIEMSNNWSRFCEDQIVKQLVVSKTVRSH